ncbi:MAG: ABC transporter ATP-binding protein [Bacilli bacterium]|nr:ABC transporter ATP-binding protein [Bacilli bacterium]
MIYVKNLSKSYKVVERSSGFKNAIRSFFKRKYRIIRAVDDITFTVKKGEIVGYIGPNGAGKSTTIKMLSGILKPDSGEVLINGMNPVDNRIKYVREIGVVFGQKSQLWWDIPATDSFDLLKDIYKIPDDEYIKTRDELIDLLELHEVVKRPVRQLSLGQRMKCELVASLLHNPKILFLDEPTIGLDAVSKVVVRDFIKKINKEKKVTVILTTHDMADIESLTSRVIVIGHGKKLYDGSINDIKKKYSNNKIVEIYYEGMKKIPKIKNTEIISNNDNIIRIRIDSRKVSVSDVTMEYARVCEIKDINVILENIDDIIYKLYEEFKI